MISGSSNFINNDRDNSVELAINCDCLLARITTSICFVDAHVGPMHFKLDYRLDRNRLKICEIFRVLRRRHHGNAAPRRQQQNA